MSYDAGSAALLQAHAAILVMRGTLAENQYAQFDRVILTPDVLERSDAEAAAALATLPPVVCAPRANGGALVIELSPPDADDLRFARMGRLMDTRDTRLDEDAPVLLFGRDEAMVLPHGALSYAWEKYLLEIPELSFGGRPPTAAERLMGVEWVVVASRATPL